MQHMSATVKIGCTVHTCRTSNACRKLWYGLLRYVSRMAQMKSSMVFSGMRNVRRTFISFMISMVKLTNLYAPVNKKTSRLMRQSQGKKLFSEFAFAVINSVNSSSENNFFDHISIPYGCKNTSNFHESKSSTFS